MFCFVPINSVLLNLLCVWIYSHKSVHLYDSPIHRQCGKKKKKKVYSEVVIEVVVIVGKARLPGVAV